jgi:hypothetical protein
MKWYIILFALLVSCQSQKFRKTSGTSAKTSCKDLVKQDLANGWKRVDIPTWDSRKTFLRNDTLGWKIAEQYNSCLIGMHSDSIVSLFGTTNGYYREEYKGYIISSSSYWCIPPNASKPTDCMELFFDFRFDTLKTISYRPLEILKE